ncbi:D-amino acid dehydrogenase small subunit [Rhodospirillaceae bacterium LM-1]|nr:D-amino acid dehydrogenase small subunit [Rhodospirillaceae bacterium LM-1]
MRVIVLGAGIVGVSTAYWLAKDGHDVTVIDRQPRPAQETSFANGGQISASHAEPWANPATPFKAIKWLGRKDAPLLWRLTRFDPELWAWGMRFLANCTTARTAINTERTLRVALYSRALLKDLNQSCKLDYDRKTEGILHIYRDGQEFELACRAAETMKNFGLNRQVVDANACVAMEPALAPSRSSLQGGIFTPEDESGDACRFTQELAKLSQALGTTFLFDTRIKAIEVEAGGFKAVLTDKGAIEAQACVVAMASYSPQLLAPLGIKVPVVPAKGYSVTLKAGPGAPSVSLTDDEHKMVYSRLNDRLRVAGTAEFSGHDTSMNDYRAGLILEKTLGLFPEAGSDPQFWTGLRPVTPDSVPIMGGTKVKGLYLNTGHGTLGWTMGLGSGRFLADILGGNSPAIDPQGLGLDRF